jgi:hypothetical protein
MSLVRAWVANIGLVLLNFAYACAHAEARHWLRAKGNLAGILAELAGRREQIGGHLK